jgi:hypothetical protein
MAQEGIKCYDTFFVAKYKYGSHINSYSPLNLHIWSLQVKKEEI